VKTSEEIDIEFTECLGRWPHHWFKEFNGSIKVMEPISYALYQTFCHHYGYEFETLDSKILLPIYQREKLIYTEMMKIKKELISRIEKIKSDEDGFGTPEWKDVNFAPTDGKTKHLSRTSLDSLSEEDLVRYFEFVIRMQVDIVSARVQIMLSRAHSELTKGTVS
jgi:hypothetical protein